MRADAAWAGVLSPVSPRVKGSQRSLHVPQPVWPPHSARRAPVPTQWPLQADEKPAELAAPVTIPYAIFKFPSSWRLEEYQLGAGQPLSQVGPGLLYVISLASACVWRPC